MIRPCEPRDLPTIHAIINDAARAYRGVIPEDRWHDPYMPLAELDREITQGVRFWGYKEGGELIGVIGLQHVEDVSLVRHAYVRAGRQRQGVSTRLLAHLRTLTAHPVSRTFIRRAHLSAWSEYILRWIAPWPLGPPRETPR